MKTPDEVVIDVDRRLTRTWAGAVTGAAPDEWPHAFPLGQPDGRSLEAEFDRYARQARDWREWAAAHNVEIVWRQRHAHGTPQELPTHLVLPDVRTAAALVCGEWPSRLSRAHKRHSVLARAHAHAAGDVGVLRSVTALSDLDFDLLLRAAAWFSSNDAMGMTPRQVPIEGMHAKWLNSRHGLVRQLAGIDDLRLLPPHPARIHFTYLDPEHRAAGRRLHDSATVGDRTSPAYTPAVVVINENKDTAIHMPPLDGAISVEGAGAGGSTAAAFEWITEAGCVFYWGDMDADGFEILNGFRAAGVPAVSLLMDMQTYEQWERYGTNDDVKGQPIRARGAKPLPHLTLAERELYECLTAPHWPLHRRVEQERIPLAVALKAMKAELARGPAAPPGP